MAMLTLPAGLEVGKGEGGGVLASSLLIHFPRWDAQKENLRKQLGRPGSRNPTVTHCASSWATGLT